MNYGSDLIREIVSRCDEMKKYNMEFCRRKSKDYVYGGSGKGGDVVSASPLGCGTGQDAGHDDLRLNFDRIDKIICSQGSSCVGNAAVPIDGRANCFMATAFPCPVTTGVRKVQKANEIDSQHSSFLYQIEANNWKVTPN